jgi:hypothetical protein
MYHDLPWWMPTQMLHHVLVLYKSIAENETCFLLQLEQSPVLHPQPTGAASMGFNPFIYGNDVDSVDIATRVAMVSAVLQLAGSRDSFVPAVEIVFPCLSHWTHSDMCDNRAFQANFIWVHVVPV